MNKYTSEQVKESLENSAKRMAEARLKVKKEFEDIIAETMGMISNSDISYKEIYSELIAVAHTTEDFNDYTNLVRNVIYHREHDK